MSEHSDLKEEAAYLQGEIDRLTARLNVVLGLLSGEPPADHVSAGPEDSTGKIAAVAPAFQPVVPREAPLPVHAQLKYDDRTEKDRKLGNALDVLDSLGKIK